MGERYSVPVIYLEFMQDHSGMSLLYKNTSWTQIFKNTRKFSGGKGIITQYSTKGPEQIENEIF